MYLNLARNIINKFIILKISLACYDFASYMIRRLLVVRLSYRGTLSFPKKLDLSIIVLKIDAVSQFSL